MKLKQRNDILLSEITISQQDTIRAGQLVHNEQRAMLRLIGRQRLTEEDAVVPSLMNAASSMEPFISIEQAKNKNFQSQLDDDRIRYEQRLSMLVSHPTPKESGSSSIDIASKVETLRLREELNAAEKALLIHHNTPNEENA